MVAALGSGEEIFLLLRALNPPIFRRIMSNELEAPCGCPATSDNSCPHCGRSVYLVGHVQRCHDAALADAYKKGSSE